MLSLILLLAVCFLGSEKRVMAGVGENVSGWAWNSNVGWISFNSADCDTDNNGFVDTDAMVLGCGGTNALPDTAFDYGVNINVGTGNFSGYAWNDNVGWISFQESNTPNDATVVANCDAGCDPTVDCTACYNATDNKIYGWAKILSMGEDGWIRFDHGQIGFEATADATANELNGWAWSSNANGTGIGWISFNCENYSSCIGGANAGEICAINADCASNNCGDTCLVSNYQTEAELNNSPTLSALSAPNWWPANACAGNTRQAELKWQFNDADGDTLKSYQLKVYESGGPLIFNSGECENGVCVNDCIGGAVGLNPGDLCDINCTGYLDGDICAYTIYENTGSGLGYGLNYEWEAQVRDSNGGLSGMVLYDNNSGADTDGDPDVNNLTFTTFISEFPNPDNFIWTPKSFSAEEDVLFESMDRAKYYVGGVENDCDDANCSWDWSDPDASGNVDIGSSNASSTIIKFNSLVNNRVELTLTDNNNGYSCASTSVFDINYKLPSWIETK
ncbi:hypothetical protein KAI65_01590 [Candidatus Parcubacteria bacterium]|nr:hypothetical protein [Candidatus Parcubacteria bacterium]